MSITLTHSFSSSDATRVTPEGRYFFDLQGATQRFSAVRVSLATLELPLSQLPVEEAWNRIRFAERFRLQPRRHRLDVVERGKGATPRVAHVALPLYANAVASLRVTASREGAVDICVQTREPHCLWPQGAAAEKTSSSSSSPSYALCWQRFDPVRLVGTVLGDVAFDPSRLTYVDANTFCIEAGRCSNAPNPSTGRLATVGYLHCPSLPGPLQVAELLNLGMRAALPEYRAAVDAIHGGVVLCASQEIPAENPVVSVEGDALAECIGLGGCVSAQWWSSSAPVCSIAASTAAKDEESWKTTTAPKASRPLFVPDGEGGAKRSSTGAWPHVLSGGAWNAYGTARLPPGAYDISMRAAGATEKHPFARTWTRGLSPLYLSPVQEKQLPQQDGEGCGLLSARILHFFDSTGGRCHVTLPLGQLSPQSLAAYLSRSMSRAARKRGAAAVRVTFEPDSRSREQPLDCWCIEGRFTFRLDGAGESGILPSPPRFGLEFDHGSTALDPSALGFDRATYSGAASYTSPSAICLPYPSGEEAAPGTRGLWFADLVGTTRRLRFSCEAQAESLIFVEGNEAPPTAEAPPAGCVLARISVYNISSGRPWAHGYRPGEFIQLRSRREEDGLPEEFLCATEDGAYLWKKYEVPAVPRAASELTLRVAAVDDSDGDAFSTLWAEVPSDISSEFASRLWILCPPRDIYPSLYLAGQGSLPGEFLGFPTMTSTRFHSGGAVEGWRQQALIHGTLGDAGMRWPLTSWSCYKFDAPDAVLVYFNDVSGKSRGTLTHHLDGVMTQPIARYIVGGLHREGGLRADSQMASGESLSTFCLRLLNPDGSAYNMHNAPFTFSLTLVCPLSTN